jgi:hypothetical protein
VNAARKRGIFLVMASAANVTNLNINTSWKPSKRGDDQVSGGNLRQSRFWGNA